ncbi:MAG: hypothetical protein KDD70_00785 [Bdellovibrionales bacterium]|nr:hypothetical protein [Bdellovibrionales bacterium]
MAAKGPFIDYVFIVLLASGVTALGANELSKTQKLPRGGEGAVLFEMREDLSTRLYEGAPLEELAPKDLDDVKARYPWVISTPGAKEEFGSSRKEEPEQAGSFMSRVKRLLGLGGQK